MAINLTYGDDADQDDIDRAILMALGRKRGYVIQIETQNSTEDVVIAAPSPSGDTLMLRHFDEESGGAVGPTFIIDRTDIVGVKVY